MQKIALSIVAVLLFAACNIQPGNKQDKVITFVSFPDFFNFDVPEPWLRWDKAVDFFLSKVKEEKPDFVLVAGDLVNGHWWDSPQCIEQMGTLYYSSWKRRMEKHHLKYYTAIGDHELGDDPWPVEKAKLVPYFENIYNQMLQMPQNGPENKKGLAYYVREGDLLLITVETFELAGDTLLAEVIGQQLEWFKHVLETNSDAKFKVVQGHVAIWGGDTIKGRSSSRLFLQKGKESEFYKTMKTGGVDLYLCGEFHDVTVLESDGIWQIVHGSSWGREVVNTQDYLVANIERNRLTVQLKRLYTEAGGGYMWNLNKNKGPREEMRFTRQSIETGPEITGTLVIEHAKGERNKVVQQTGYFSK